MKTTLTPERLAELHAKGKAQAASTRFVDPGMVNQVERLLAQRGEEWAASVLMRDLSRRTGMKPSFPWFEVGDMEIILLAFSAELDLLAESLQAADGIEGELSGGKPVTDFPDFETCSKVNVSVKFHPGGGDGPACMEIGGILVFAYFEPEDKTVRVTIHPDSVREGLFPDGQAVPFEVEINDKTVYRKKNP